MKQLKEIVLESSGLNLIEDQRLHLLYELAGLLAGYDRANIIGTKDLDEILSEHVADSLSCMQYEPLRGATKVVDVGSGGGLPALPLSVLMGEAGFDLVESNGKKVAFLEQAVENLSIGNVVVHHQRAEEFASEFRHRGSFEFATARALARLDVLAEYCVPLLRTGGVLVAMKAGVSEEELDYGERAAELLGGRIEEVRAVKRSGLQREKKRNLVILRKIRETPVKYPRKTGVPAKSPLGSL